MTADDVTPTKDEALQQSIVVLEMLIERFEEDDAASMWFGLDDEDRERGFTHQLALPARDWSGMGSPVRITVTIQPGDLLNPDAEPMYDSQDDLERR